MTNDWLSLFTLFPYALAAGLLVGVACALLGVVAILKRVVFIGMALSEIAACGIAGALLVGQPPVLGAVVLTLGAVGLLAGPFESRRIPRDALLGVLFAGAASISVLLVSGSGMGLHEVKSLLYGDLILASRGDVLLLAGVLGGSMTLLMAFQRPLRHAFVDREAAIVLGVRPARWEKMYFLLLGLVVATASKVAGSLLVFCYLVVPAAAALLLSRRMGRVLALAAGLSVLATLGGMAVSFRWDWPTNPAICAVACGGFGGVALVAAWRGRHSR